MLKRKSGWYLRKAIERKPRRYSRKTLKSEDTGDKKEQASEKSELESLQEQMKAAINEQRFEDAAVIRDKIKEIQEGKNE